jgi:hypothetical protein
LHRLCGLAGMLERSPLASERVCRRAASAIVVTSPRNRARIASRATLKGFISATFMVAFMP